MCDPFTLLLGAVGALGASSANMSAPPAPAIPAPPVRDALDETGAEVALGGDRESDQEDATVDNISGSKKTSGSGLSTKSNKTGISIL